MHIIEQISWGALIQVAVLIIGFGGHFINQRVQAALQQDALAEHKKLIEQLTSNGALTALNVARLTTLSESTERRLTLLEERIYQRQKETP